MVLVAGSTVTAHAATARHRSTNARTGRVATAFADLVKAVRKGDRAGLERLVSRMGPVRFEEGLRSGDARVVEATLSSVSLVRGRVLLTGSVAERLDAGESTVAIAAARALGDLLDGASPSELEEWEVPPDVVGRACGSLRNVAARLETAVRIRLAALDALARAQRTCTATAELASLLRDPVPAIRRSVALLLRPSERQVAAALKDAIRDPEPAVASAAVAAVCRAEAAPGKQKRDQLLEQSTAAARIFAPAGLTPPEDAVEMLACVAAAGTAADRGLLDQLRRGPPSPLRDRAAELADSSARLKPE